MTSGASAFLSKGRLPLALNTRPAEDLQPLIYTFSFELFFPLDLG
jgi:hypothetical protein